MFAGSAYTAEGLTDPRVVGHAAKEVALGMAGGVAAAAFGGALATGGVVTEGATLGASTPASVPAMVFGTGIAMAGVSVSERAARELWTGQRQTSILEQIGGRWGAGAEQGLALVGGIGSTRMVGTVARAPKNAAGVMYRIGRPVQVTPNPAWEAMSIQERIDLVVAKYRFGLRGKKVKFEPDFPGWGRVAEAQPRTLVVGQKAVESEVELARTVAHELRHSRAYLGSGSNAEAAAEGSEEALWYYIRGRK